MERASGLGQGIEEPPPILRSTAVPADNAALPVHPLTTSALLELIAICCDVRGNAAPNLALRSRTERLVALHAARDRTNVANRLPNFGLHCLQAFLPVLHPWKFAELDKLNNSCSVFSPMGGRSNLSSGGIHVIADIVVAAGAAFGAIFICYPMYIAAVVIKAAWTNSSNDA